MRAPDWKDRKGWPVAPGTAEDWMALPEIPLGRYLLADLGFMTRRACNASDALAILEADHATIDIVFSDVIMPGMNGVELGGEIRRRWPDLTVILTSGYSHVLADDTGHGFALLNKPYSADELSRILRDARQPILRNAGSR